MKILTFDIECAKTYADFTPICNFGYAIIDENNKLIEKNDVIINPGTNFRLNGRSGRPDVKLHYSIQEYLKAPKFPEVYNKIVKLLTQPDLLILNHAVINDLRYLKNEIKRYHLTPFEFIAYDTADVYKQFLSIENQKYKSLTIITNELNLDSYEEHKADDDAYAAYQIFHKLCLKLELDPTQLIALSNTKPYSMMEEYNKEIKPSYKLDMEPLIKKMKNRNLSNRFLGQSVTVSKNIEDDFELLKPIVQYIIDCSGTYTRKVSECNILIYREDDNCVRLRIANLRNTEFHQIQLISYDEFKRFMLEDFIYDR